MSYYDVYLVNYQTRVKKADHHQALFIEIDKETDFNNARGSIYEVRGPKHDRQTYVFYFRFGTKKAPKASPHFRSMKKIGRITTSNIESVLDICEKVTPPKVASTYNGESPNCCDWINNVIYRLNKKRIVEFDDGYDIPSGEVAMVSKDANAMEKGSSSNSGKSSSSAGKSK